jgi:hypothetical protein
VSFALWYGYPLAELVCCVYYNSNQRGVTPHDEYLCLLPWVPDPQDASDELPELGHDHNTYFIDVAKL